MQFTFEIKKRSLSQAPVPTTKGWLEARLNRYAQLSVLMSLGHCGGFGLLKVRDMPVAKPEEHIFQYGLLVTLSLFAILLGMATAPSRLDCDGKPFALQLEANLPLAASGVGGATIITGLMGQDNSEIGIGLFAVAISSIGYMTYLFLKRRRAFKTLNASQM
jgi:hypothetical protein